MSTRADLVFKATLAEHAERYDDMAKFMKQVAREYDTPLQPDERNLLSVAYKNVVGPLRSGWRVLVSIEEQEAGKEGIRMTEIEDYKSSVESKLEAVCNEISDLITGTLTASDSSLEGKVFYYKMNGDYHRYLAEIQSGESRKASAGKAEMAYQKATDLAQDGIDGDTMKPTHPIRLGLALNFSVFYYEIADNGPKAMKMAQTAFDNAMAELDNVDENEYKDATLIMQLLKDNLTLWNDEENVGKEGDLEVQDFDN